MIARLRTLAYLCPPLVLAYLAACLIGRAL